MQNFFFFSSNRVSPHIRAALEKHINYYCNSYINEYGSLPTILVSSAGLNRYFYCVETGQTIAALGIRKDGERHPSETTQVKKTAQERGLKCEGTDQGHFLAAANVGSILDPHQDSDYCYKYRDSTGKKLILLNEYQGNVDFPTTTGMTFFQDSSQNRWTNYRYQERLLKKIIQDGEAFLNLPRYASFRNKTPKKGTFVFPTQNGLILHSEWRNNTHASPSPVAPTYLSPSSSHKPAALIDSALHRYVEDEENIHPKSLRESSRVMLNRTPLTPTSKGIVRDIFEGSQAASQAGIGSSPYGRNLTKSINSIFQPLYQNETPVPPIYFELQAIIDKYGIIVAYREKFFEDIIRYCVLNVKPERSWRTDHIEAVRLLQNLLLLTKLSSSEDVAIVNQRLNEILTKYNTQRKRLHFDLGELTRNVEIIDSIDTQKLEGARKRPIEQVDETDHINPKRRKPLLKEERSSLPPPLSACNRLSHSDQSNEGHRPNIGEGAFFLFPNDATHLNSKENKPASQPSTYSLSTSSTFPISPQLPIPLLPIKREPTDIPSSPKKTEYASSSSLPFQVTPVTTEPFTFRDRVSRKRKSQRSKILQAARLTNETVMAL